MSHYIQSDTIVALATPPGEGGIAVVRVSGPRALEITSKIFTSALAESHKAVYGRFFDDDGVIDTGLALPMLGGKSFTGDETVEYHCHGGPLIVRRLVKAVQDRGARAALPGEFTFRSFMNNKIDLAQAEAVQAAIAAKSDLAVTAASDQLQGRLSNLVRGFQAKLIDLAAIIEAWVDFPEEGIEFGTLDEHIATVGAIKQEVQALCDTFLDGQRARTGISIALVGAPNVGKSSLMNQLIDRDRAIVTAIAGTTRDVLEEEFCIGQIHGRLVDTAGIRQTQDVIEKEGIRRSVLALEKADLVLYVIDASQPDLSLEVPADKTITVWNKADLLPAGSAQGPGILVSAKTGQGIDHLKREIDRVVWKNGPPDKGEVVVTLERHKQALDRALEALGCVESGLVHDLSPELISLDLKQALQFLSQILGHDITEDILSSIFSKFCIGK